MPINERPFQAGLQQMAAKWRTGASAALLVSTAAITQASSVHAASLGEPVSMPTTSQSNHIMRNETSRPMSAVVARLHQLGSDWDTYGSPPIPQMVLDRVADILSTAAREGLASPSVVPFEGGGVQLEWYESTHGLEFAIHTNGELEYLLVRRPDDTLAEDETPQLDGDLAHQYMQRFNNLVREGRQ